MPRTLSFGARAVLADQTRILQAALESIRPERCAAAFDLDSTLLSNKPRQARIVREFGRERGIEQLVSCGPSEIVSWDLRDTLRLCGITEEAAEEIGTALKDFWRERFFTSEYCKDDVPVAGAREFLERTLAAGGHVLYITGRHTGMGEGTLASFRAAARGPFRPISQLPRDG